MEPTITARCFNPAFAATNMDAGIVDELVHITPIAAMVPALAAEQNAYVLAPGLVRLRYEVPKRVKTKFPADVDVWSAVFDGYHHPRCTGSESGA